MKKNILKISALVVIFALLGLMAPVPPNVQAALTNTSVTMSTLTVSTAANYTIQFTTSAGVAASGTVVLTFPGGTDVNATDGLLDYTDVDLEDDGVDLALLGSVSGVSWGVGVTATAITLTNGSTAVAGGSVIKIEIGTNATSEVAGDKQMVNQSAAENKADRTLDITGDDSGTINIYVNPSEADVTVSATVAPTLSMSLTGTTPNLGTLDTEGVDLDPGTANNQIPGTKITVSTNAISGVDITAKDEAAGLDDGNGNDIDDAADGTWASQSGNEAFGVMVTQTAGDWDAANNYVTDDGTDTYEGLTATASETIIYNGAGVESDKNVYAGFNAQIVAATITGSYNDVVTFIATATF